MHASEEAAPTRLVRSLGGRSDWWKPNLAREIAAAEPDRRIVWIDGDLAEQVADTRK
jgi:hypothetical protein